MRLILASAIFLTMAGVAPTTVQAYPLASVEAEQPADAFQIVEAALARMNAASQVLADERLRRVQASGDLKAIAAALTELEPHINQSRAALREAVTSLEKVDALTSGSANGELFSSIATDAIRSGQDVDRLLGLMQELPAAVSANDAAKIQQVATAMVSGGIRLIDSQALVLRSRLIMIPQDSSEYASITALSEGYTAFANGMRAAIGITAPDIAQVSLDQSLATMSSAIQNGRAALAEELKAVEVLEGAQKVTLDRMLALQGQVFDTHQQTRDALATFRAALAKATTPEQRSAAFSDLGTRFGGIESRQQILIGQMFALNGELTGKP